MKVKIPDGRVIDCVTRSQLADMCKRAPSTFVKFEKRGILPKSNLVIPSANPSFTTASTRLYSRELAHELSRIFQDKSKINQGERITENTKIEIVRLFRAEKERLGI